MGPNGGKYLRIICNCDCLVKIGGGFFMIKNSNDVYDEEFQSIDPFSY